MQDQLTSGQTNLQQQDSNLQQGQTNIQQNSGVAGASPDTSSLLNTSTPTQLQVQSQGQKADTPQQTTIPEGGVSALLIGLIIIPTIIVIAVFALLKPQPEPGMEETTPEEPTEPTPQPTKPKPKPKSKKKQTRRKRTAKR